MVYAIRGGQGISAALYLNEPRTEAQMEQRMMWNTWPCMNPQLYLKETSQPRQARDEEARSLVIFDEVQFCPRARAAIKHLVADRRYDYIEKARSFPSRRCQGHHAALEHAIEMFPMDFEEFLWAMGDEMLMPYRPDAV